MKKLTRHGNSWALVIDKPVLDLLKIDPAETPMELSTDGDTLIVSPVRDLARRRKFEAAIAETHRRYGRALTRLSE